MKKIMSVVRVLLVLALALAAVAACKHPNNSDDDKDTPSGPTAPTIPETVPTATRIKDGEGNDTEWVQLSSGTFQMGSTSTNAQDNEKPVHAVGLSSFLICDHEVTQKEYETYCSYSSLPIPSTKKGKGDTFPAYFVSWYDAIVYCNLRSTAEGLEP
ncbi:MAG: SUMF1/EgtB/PvdO family nonheme iron enzyme [Treponema sp.]|nr:SUMF1/EgtB/PvdO family nonheme iron enzyme [Treponema sp.]